MAGGEKEEVEILLERLHSSSFQNGSGDPEASQDCIVDISELLCKDLTNVQYELYINLILEGSNNILLFGRNTAKKPEFVASKKGTLDIINSILKRNSKYYVKYGHDIWKYSLFLYNVDKAAKVREAALELFCLVILERHSVIDVEDLNLNRLIESIAIEIRGSAKSSTVRGQQLITLGVICFCFPQNIHQAPLIFKILKEMLVRNTQNKPDLPVLAGSLRGLAYYLHHFPQGIDDEEAFHQEIYTHLHKVLNPNLNLPRRDAQRAGLELLHKHAAKFAPQLMTHHETLFRWLMHWCRSNRDDSKAGKPAMDSFLIVLSNVLELHAHDKDDSEPKIIFKYFLREFKKIIEGSTHSYEISLALKGYGLLSGTCRQLMSPQDVHTMFTEVLAASQHSFFHSNEMLETRLSSLPSYIESLAIIIQNMDVGTGNMDSVQSLAQALVQNYPMVISYHKFLAHRAFMALLAAVYTKGQNSHNFIQSFVYQTILQTCSHPPIINSMPGDGGDWRDVGDKEAKNSQDSSGWSGLNNEITTFRSFLPLWKAIILPEKVSSIKVSGVAATVLTEISNNLYHQFINCCLDITTKLDLETIQAQNQKVLEPSENQSSDENDIAVSSDPIAMLQARTPKDFQIYLNLVGLMEEVLPEQAEGQMKGQVGRLLWFWVTRSSHQPLVAPHYQAITGILKAAQTSDFFKESNRENNMVNVLVRFVREVVERMRQYRDQLLSSCLTFLMHLPKCVLEQVFPSLVSPLQVALKMGMSYLPLAEVCVSALQKWHYWLPQHLLQAHLPQVLPYLLPYITTQDTGGESEVQARAMDVKMAQVKIKRKVDTKKLQAGKKVVSRELERVQMSILQLIGSLEPELSSCVVPQDADTVANEAIRWDTQRHIKFAIPFMETKIDIYLDDMLPEILNLALNSSDRQAKVAASELLHSCIILMIGTGAQRSSETNERFPMAPIYRRVFSAMLQLSCDQDQVTRQLFLTLTFQTIHWFTNNRNFENPDTAVLLEACMEGVVSANDPALRDISAQSLAEFVKWSRKQSRDKESANINIKSIFKRIFSNLKHPSAFKRLGGCLAWNSIYREVREDEAVVDTWILQLLVHLLDCLELAESDDPALGTHTQAQQAVRHVTRIMVVKKDLFNKSSNQRSTPIGAEGNTLNDLLLWLLNKCGKPKSLLRHSVIELLSALAPHTAKAGGKSFYRNVCDFLKNHSNNALVMMVEGGGGNSGEGTGGRCNGISSLSKPKEHTVKHLTIFCEALLAALDGYTWLLAMGVAQPTELLEVSESELLPALGFFLNNLAGRYLSSYLQECQPSPSPLEVETTTKLHCTLVIRFLDFVQELSRSLPQESRAAMQTLSDNSIWNTKVFKLIWICVLDPASIGFDLRDTEVSSNFPQRLEDTLNLLARSVPESVMTPMVNVLEEMLNHFHPLKILHPLIESGSSFINPSVKQTFSSIAIINRTSWFGKCSNVSPRLSNEIIDSVTSYLFETQGDKVHISRPTSQQILLFNSLVDLAVALDANVVQFMLSLVKDITDVKGGCGVKGGHVLECLSESIMAHLAATYSQETVAAVRQLMDEGHFSLGSNLANALLDCLRKSSQLRVKHSKQVVEAFLYHWSGLASHSSKSSIHRDAILVILSSLLLIDRNGTIKASLNIDKSQPLVQFYQDFLKDPKADLQSKTQALKLLPFFLEMNEELEISICECLEVMSVNHFPLRSSEFPAGGARDKQYKRALIDLLAAVELYPSNHLLKFISNLFCREDQHRYVWLLEDSLQKCIRTQTTSRRIAILTYLFSHFCTEQVSKQYEQHRGIKVVLMPLVQSADNTTLHRFLVDAIKTIMAHVASPVSGRSEQQLAILVNKTAAFSILQVMYCKSSKEKVFSADSEIAKSFKPLDDSGKDMTKEVLRYAAKIAKGELRHDQTHRELRRECACSAYNTLIATISCIQNDIKFFTNFLFTENSTKGEALWETLIDCNIKHEFEIEVNFKPGSQKRFVSVRKNRKAAILEAGGVNAGTVKYMASHYLSDSSLREDLSQFDFTSSVVLALSQGGSQRKTNSTSNVEDLVLDISGSEDTIQLDRSDYNDHEIMANLIAVIRHMVETGIMALKSDLNSTAEQVPPQWITSFQTKLEKADTPRNVKLFILRLMSNTAAVFQPFANNLLPAVLECVVDGTLGSSISYFLADIMVLVLSWGVTAQQKDSTLISRVLHQLCVNTPHTRADVFKYNVQLVRVVVEQWKSFIQVPYSVIYAMMEVKNGEKREVEAGLQLLGIMMANGLPPYTPDNKSHQERCERLLLRLIGEHLASVYCAAAEVLGLSLKYSQNQSQESSLLETTFNCINEMIIRKQDQGLTVIYYIQKHHPAIVERFASRLLMLLPRLYGIFRCRVLECLVSHAQVMEDVFTNLKEKNLLDTLSRKEANTQLVALQMVKSVMTRLTAPQLLYFMDGVAAFSNHQAPSCRQIMYDILVWTLDNFSSHGTTEGQQIEKQARSVLLCAVKEEDAALRQSVLNYWIQDHQDLPLHERLVHIIEKLYSSESESTFLQTASYILLEATRHSPDYQRPIFPLPLTECKFREMRVSTAWQARHASMVPLFAMTQSSQDSSSSISALISLTQGSETGQEGLPQIQATQANVFSMTQQPGSTYNWITESTFDSSLADMEYEATHSKTQGSTGGLLFTVGVGGSRDMKTYKQPGLGKSKMKAPDEVDSATQNSNLIQSHLVRRRFVRNQDKEKEKIFHVRQEDKRVNLRQKLEVERRRRREAQVTMYRQYRVGELPDVQISHRAVIAPLQALAQGDSKIAHFLFVALVQGVVESISLPIREEEEWKEQLHKSLVGILENTSLSSVQLLTAVLQLMINNDMTADPDSLAKVCVAGQVEALGILVLERKVLLDKKGSVTLQPPRKKKRGDDIPLGDDMNLKLSLAEMYKSLSMWEVVLGLVKTCLGDIESDTRSALEAQAANNPVIAFKHYRQALESDDQSSTEKKILSEWYSNCAAQLGQWEELETFMHTNVLTAENGAIELPRIWHTENFSEQSLSWLVHSKLMQILDGKDGDGGLCSFIENSLREPQQRFYLESILPVQLAVLSLHQSNIPMTKAHLKQASSQSLQQLSQYSLLTPRPLITTLRNLQLITEMQSYINQETYLIGEDELSLKYLSRAKTLTQKWNQQKPNQYDAPVFTQCLAQYRDMYSQFMKQQIKKYESDDETCSFIDTCRRETQQAVVEVALNNSNHHLAFKHLKKLRAIESSGSSENSTANFYFLMTSATMLRGHVMPEKRLQYLIEAWAKYMGKVNNMDIFDKDPMVEVKYWSLEGKLCYEICEALQDLTDEDINDDNPYIKVLAQKFPGSKERTDWYKQLLHCSFDGLKKAVQKSQTLEAQKEKRGNSESKNLFAAGKGVHMVLAAYCEECLDNWRDTIPEDEYSDCLVRSLLQAMARGDREAHFRFPRCIALLEENPHLSDKFRHECKSVPTWMFLLWVNHILIYMDKSPGPALLTLLERIAETYPQALVYPFGISRESYNMNNNPGLLSTCGKIENILLKSCNISYQFISAMKLVVVPHVAAMDGIKDVRMEKDKKKIEEKLADIHTRFFKPSVRGTKGMPAELGEAYLNLGTFRVKAKEIFNKGFGENLKNIKSMSLESIKSVLNQVYQELNKETCKANQLKGYSKWLANFQGSNYSECLEIPGQYHGMSKPLVEYHINVSSFDDRVLVMNSLRKPIRISIRGDDEKDHKYLVKWGEDLRTDQRMEQVFSLMNNVYSRSSVCGQTSVRPFLETYQVVPLSRQVGILQWVEATTPLQQFMKDAADNPKCLDDAFKTYYSKGNWEISKKVGSADVIKHFETSVNKLPWDLLRSGLIKLSRNSQGFFYLRSAFAVTYATLCVSHWLLGIGDRHSENSLVSMKTGRVIGIDFGHHFESSTQFLPFPELIPFRLTPQIANVFQPLGYRGMMRETMVATLKALTDERHILMATMEAFVKEPTDDWLEFVSRQEGSHDEAKVETFSKERIKMLRAKLRGINPAYVIEWAVSKNKNVIANKTVLSFLKTVVLGTPGVNLRADFPHHGLTPNQQVDALLDLATDPNILGRTYVGWKPFL